MRESIRKLVRIGSRRSVHLQRHVSTFLIAPTIQSHEICDLWKEWEVGSGKIEGLPNAEARAEAVARVDAIFPERMRQIHIGSSLVYPGVGQVSYITIDYTTTTDSCSTFVTVALRKSEVDDPLPSSPV